MALTPLEQLVRDQRRALTRFEALEGRVLALERDAERLRASNATMRRELRNLRKTRPVKIVSREPQRGIRSWDATTVREHIHKLTATGWKQQQIAATTGLSKGLISGLATGKRATISPRAEALILTIRPERTRP